MKPALVDALCCPECQGTLTLTTFESAAQEVEEGLLTCGGCRRAFPVTNGIPRLLPDALMHLAVAYHPAFFQRPEAAAVRHAAEKLDDRWWDAERRTVKSYSYQWRKFKQMFPEWERVFNESITPLTPQFFAGKRGLDAGCGFGRSLFYSGQYGAEMIGLDLSEAIEAARENTRHLPNVHLVQGDIFHPPVRRGTLDFVYSIGVLHHLPDPKGGFLALTPLIRPGGAMCIWVYLRGRGRQIWWFTRMRAISTRTPLRLLNLLTLLLAVAQWLLFILPYRVLRALGLRALAARIPFTLYAQYPFRALHTDWFDGLAVPLQNYYKPDDIRGWYREGGYAETRIEPESTWNGRALGYRPK